MECVNQMKKEFLITVKICLVIPKASEDHPCENATSADRVDTDTKSKNDRRNSGGTLRQKFNLIDIWTNGPMDQWTN